MEMEESREGSRDFISEHLGKSGLAFGWKLVIHSSGGSESSATQDRFIFPSHLP